MTEPIPVEFVDATGLPIEMVEGLVTGPPGKSAYEVAVDEGFVGTEQDWLDSLHGQDGQDGQDGSAGPSAYQVAVANGFIGSEAAWLASLNGQDGQDGQDGESAYQVALANGFVGGEAAWLASLNGQDGQDGQNGQDGADGIGIPAGGTTGQVLAKGSNNDFDTEWVDQTGGGPAGNQVVSDITGLAGAGQVLNIVKLPGSTYDPLVTKEPDTFYVVERTR